MSEQRYATPEGFELWKPLIFPDVRSFDELFTFERWWDFATMNHKNGYPQADTPEEITREGWDKVVSRFCAVKNLPGGRHMQVTPTALVLDKIYADESESLDFAFFDRVSFELIYHEANNRVLVVADASQIIASRWLAYIDPATVPTLESAATTWPRVIEGETLWACCVSSIGPACRHRWIPCLACGEYFDPTTSELSVCELCR